MKKTKKVKRPELRIADIDLELKGSVERIAKRNKRSAGKQAEVLIEKCINDNGEENL